MGRFNKRKKGVLLSVAAAVCLLASAGIYTAAKAAEEDDTIVSGVYIGNIDVSNMSKEEARAAVETHMQEVSGSSVVLMVGEQAVEVPVSELGFSIRADDIYEEAAGLCKKGNVVKRYKDTKRLEQEGMHYDLRYTFDEALVRQAIEQKCTAFDQPAVNAGLKRTGSGFEITDGVVGYQVDVEQSVALAMEFLEKEWSPQNTAVSLAVAETQPKGTRDELAKVTDLLATATTSYSTSGKNRCGNVERGTGLINGTVLYPGDEFSTYATVSPITVENGYFMAASYAEGQVVESPGGGICQVSTTLYNAVLKAELDVTQRSNHSMIVTYVDPAKDAAIAGTYKDLKFVNNTDAPIYIEGITADKKITFNIYGMETRSDSRKVEFVSETIEETEPTTEIKLTAEAAFGTVSSQSDHKGIVAKLWKVVTENGQEVSRTEVNKSKYAMSPKVYTVGTANATPEAMAELEVAAASQNIDAVKAVIGKYGTVNNDAVSPTQGDDAAEGIVGVDPNAQQADPNGQQADPNAQQADPNAQPTDQSTQPTDAGTALGSSAADNTATQ